MTASTQSGRYLTESAKEAELARWHGYRDETPPEGTPRWHGWPDPPIFPWCDALNALPGVCTLQSCSGHRRPDGYLYPGQLWLWLSQPLASRFEERVAELCALPRIERVRKLWIEHPEGQYREVVDVLFDGLEEHHDLAPVLEPLVAFFGRLDEALG